MGKVIRRTVTITISETWTIIWLPGDDPPPHPPTVGQEQANMEEQPDEAIQATLIVAELRRRHIPAAVDPPPGAPCPNQLGGLPADNSTTRRRSKRSRIRRAKENHPRQ
jgi:hypothetical protein